MKNLTDRIQSLTPEQRALFEQRLKQKNLNAQQLSPNPAAAAIPRRNHTDPSPLSFDQERLWFFNRMHPESHAYNVYGAARLRGKLHHGALEYGINEIVKRHEAWRTVFGRVDPVQIVLPELRVSVPVVDLRDIPEEEREVVAQKLMREEVQQLFDLAKGPLIRFKLFTLSDTEWTLVLTIHHIVIDRLTFSIFFEELMVHYKAALAGVPAELPELPIQYADYAEWQRNYLQGETREKLLAFWKEQLKDCDYVLDIHTDFPRPPAITYRGARVFLRSSKEILDGLKAIAKRENASTFMIVMAAFKALLYRYTGQADILVGTPLANRNRIEMEKVMGYFLTMGTLRSHMSGEMSFIDLLRQVRDTAREVYKHQELPVGLLLDELRVPIDPSRNPLVQAVFVYVDVPEEKFALPELEADIQMIDGETAKYDVTIGLTETEDGLDGFLEYSPDLFRRETFERMSLHWETLLQSIVLNPQQSIHELGMLSDEERHQLIEEWNETAQPFPDDSCIHRLFERQAELTPDDPAVVCGGQSMTYRELNRRANQVAHALRKRGVGRETAVGLMMERSFETVVGLLGILKAGGAYVAIDPAYPAERIRTMIDDSGIEVLLIQPKLADAESEPILAVRHKLVLDGTWQSVAEESADNPRVEAGAGDLAYVMYTSGSTGKPNAVAIEHRSVCNAVEAAIGLFGLSRGSRMLQYASTTFDASVLEIFATLSSGAALCLVSPEATAGGEALHRLLEEQRITAMLLTPSVLSTLNPARLPASLRTVGTGGEACTLDLRAWLSDSIRLLNLYGPTEATIFATAHEFDAASPSACIGRPVANTQIYILDESLQPVPVGVRGEMYISGAGLARGYRNNPVLTAERFVDHPFRPVEVMYRTGDYGCRLPDGSIEYLGRRDDQVKLNGIRIETGEIEATLNGHPAVKEAAVLVRPVASASASGKALCAYYVADRELDAAELRALLLDRLPAYMVPAHYVRLEAFPLTSSGKLDRKRLPEPAAAGGSATEFVPPEGELEELMASVWQEVLGGETVGREDNFFHLGGDSIKAIQIASRLYRRGWDLEMKKIFLTPVLKELCLDLKPVDGQVQISQDAVEGPIADTPIVRWFFDRDFASSAHWNLAVMLHSETALDETALKRALEKLAGHHDVLRSVVRDEEGRKLLYNRGPEEQPLIGFEVVALDGGDSMESAVLAHANRLHESIDLANGPLMKTALFRTPQGDHLLLVAHHLVMDWVSWRIVLEDLEAAYEQALTHEGDIVMPPKTHSFQAWAEAVQQYARSGKVLREADYWAAVESTPCVPVPRDFEATGNLTKDEAQAMFTLPTEETEQLLKQVHRAYHTEINDILLTALGLTLKEWMNTNRIVIQLEGHGRENVVKAMNTTRTVGWFTSQFPIVLPMEPTDDLGYQIKSVKEHLRQLPNHGIGYGLLKYITPRESVPGLTFTQQPDICFNYIGQIDTDLRKRWFGPSPWPVGRLTSPEAERTASLFITGYVQDRRLHIAIDYNRTHHRHDTIAALLDKLQSRLLDLIRHCGEQNAAEATPSDLGYNRLTLQELDQLYDLVDTIE
ncbi:non-ribosomal peptide synthetase [Paenibacillus oleatilyticus]|uniref:non-ribosomal peptide synthetase n=1 Tax=Paenibacillus oleatilyticus TaxID=2594886 RepID=UPI001C1FB52F|nr:non-ribosomal peptide synthetase [Paenibacillus oleatilyticus]MBU7318222.1 amino acid adenylation domain-containing protein [Paenibacillus oleatilyticus]